MDCSEMFTNLRHILGREEPYCFSIHLGGGGGGYDPLTPPPPNLFFNFMFYLRFKTPGTFLYNQVSL